MIECEWNLSPCKNMTHAENDHKICGANVSFSIQLLVTAMKPPVEDKCLHFLLNISHVERSKLASKTVLSIFLHKKKEKTKQIMKTRHQTKNVPSSSNSSIKLF